MNPVVFLPLTRGQVAVIDFEDFDRVGRVKWYAEKVGRCFYAARKPWRKKKIYLHSVVLGRLWVDHKNGDGLDNRRDNLRPASQAQNNLAFKRKRPAASSKFRGVFWHEQTQKWTAKTQCRGVPIYLGEFVREEDAARAFDTAARKAGFLPEALNFP